MAKPPLPIALTMGDPAGIGLDVTILTWTNREKNNIPPFFLIASPQAVKSRAETLGIDLPMRTVSPGNCASEFDRHFPIVPLSQNVNESSETSCTTDSPAILKSIETGVDFCLHGVASSLVTNPICKKTLYDSGFQFGGHTEYLGHLAQKSTDRKIEPVMLLYCEQMKTVPVTIHLPLSEVPKSLTKQRIEKTANIVNEELKGRFNIPQPRLAIAGLNPHAGESGSIGREEIDVILPAIESLKADGIEVQGPLSADTLFHQEKRAQFDCFIAMYHDQALIPIKTIDFDNTVNVTLGLNFIRTSPDHGTAFDIAGTGRAKPNSLIAAIKLAGQIAENEGNKNNGAN